MQGVAPRVRVWPAIVLLATVGSVVGQEYEEVRKGLRARERQLSHLYVEFDWLGCPAPRCKDPFDPSNWQTGGDRVLRFSYRVWLARPDLKLEIRDLHDPGRDETKNWVNGRGVWKVRDGDEPWSVSIDDNRLLLTGPVPFLTPLEMQIFDHKTSLVELVEEGKLQIESQTDETVVLAGWPGYFRPSWHIQATLDRTRGLLPVELKSKTKDGTIHWTMKTIQSVGVADTHAIKEAIIALSNSMADRKHWQIYHYQARRVQADATLSKQELEIKIPQRNVNLVNEIAGFARQIDASGRVTVERHWSPEEREKQLEAAARLAARQREEQAQRARMFKAIVGGSTILVLGVAGLWVWRQRSRRLA